MVMVMMMVMVVVVEGRGIFVVLVFFLLLIAPLFRHFVFVCALCLFFVFGLAFVVALNSVFCLLFVVHEVCALGLSHAFAFAYVFALVPAVLPGLGVGMLLCGSGLARHVVAVGWNRWGHALSGEEEKMWW